MKIIRLNCFDGFRCLSDKCEETCCKGWEITVDDETYKKYVGLNDEFSKRITGEIKRDKRGYVFKNKNGKCPFLNENGLCDVQSRLGEDYLSEVCYNHPRFFVDFGNVREITYSFSCPKVCDMLLGFDGDLDFTETNDGEIVINDVDARKYSESAILRKEIFKIITTGATTDEIFTSAYRACGLKQKKPNAKKLLKRLLKCDIYNRELKNAIKSGLNDARLNVAGFEFQRLKRVIVAVTFRYFLELSYYESTKKALDFIYKVITYAEILSVYLGEKKTLIYFSKEILHDENNIKKIRRRQL